MALSLLAILVFAVALWRCRIAAVVEEVVGLGMAGLMAMLDRELPDDDKEVAVRRAGLSLLAGSLRIVWRLGAALALAATPVVIADRLGLVSREVVLELFLDPYYLVVVSVSGIVLAGAARRRWPDPARGSAEDDRNSATDQFVHAIAFSTPAVLKGASWLDDRLRLGSASEPSGAPVFVTSVARAGTTAVLNALSDVPDVATHTYRDMPFLTAPSSWNRLAGGNRRRVDRHERAHGDGLQIDLDSPEAFEEVVWRLFWPTKYRASSIDLWCPEDRKPEAERFLHRHMAKVVEARRVQRRNKVVEPSRYCSKNNTNIARLRHLREAFPGCHVVVPVRRPESHASSLLRQHENFSRRQADDDFVRRYMRDIGHFEFGLIHKPIAFDGFDPDAHDRRSGDYWLHYWIQAYREVLAHADACVLVTQDDLRASPQETMTALCDVLGLSPDRPRFGDHFRSGRDEARTDQYDPRLLDEAFDVYRELEARALRPPEVPAR